MRSFKIFLASAAAAVAGLFVHQHAANYSAPGQVEPVALASPIPAAAHSDLGALLLEPVTNATPEQADLILASEAKIREVVNSQCFVDFIAARTLVTDNSTNGTNGLTNAQVITRIRQSEGRIPVTVYHQPWYKPSTVMGYRNVGESLIHLRDTSLDSVCDTASLEAHEAIGHVLGGWDHDYKATAQREFSVPYSINAAFSACCKEGS